MTYKQWERKLQKELRSLPADERTRVLEYYREMRDEMASCGKTEERILVELGSPENCARQMMEDGSILPKKGGKTSSSTAKKGSYSFAGIIGLLFVTLMVVLPIGCVLFSIVVAMAAVCVSGAAVAVAGIVTAVVYPFMSASQTAAIAGVGVGLATSGCGLLLFVGFFYATKYSAIGSAKFFKAIYKRR